MAVPTIDTMQRDVPVPIDVAVPAFPGVVVNDDGNLTATITLKSYLFVDFVESSMPDGWTFNALIVDDTRTCDCTARTAAQMIEDLRSITLIGVALGTATLTLLIDDGSDTASATGTAIAMNTSIIVVPPRRKLRFPSGLPA